MSDEYSPPAPPAELKAAGRQLWTDTVAAMEFESHELKILGQAALTLDLLAVLQEHVDLIGRLSTARRA